MSQHFLLSAAARTLSLKEIYRGGEDKAHMMFRKLRWHMTDGAPVCPRCGGLVHLALGVSLAHPVSRQWKGYWQR